MITFQSVSLFPVHQHATQHTSMMAYQINWPTLSTLITELQFHIYKDTQKKHIQANIWTKKHDLCREFDDNSSLLGHDTMQTGIQLSEFCSCLMSPSSDTQSKKTLMCQSKQHYVPNGLNLQQHHCQNQKFCRDFINREKRCEVYISSGIDRILIMEMRWAEHVAWMEKRKKVHIQYLGENIWRMPLRSWGDASGWQREGSLGK